VFKLNGGSETVLHSFAGSPDGAFPLPGLIHDSAGNLYGTTFEGGTGSGSSGTIFRVTATGNDAVLYSFTGSPDGDSPFSVLTRDSFGNFYGTTRSGGAFGFGSVFKLSKRGKETVLYSFSGGPDGGTPFGGLILDSAGTLYGTTYAGGASAGHGVVFKLDEGGTETVLHTFTASTDGANPYAGLTRDNQGNLYGTTYFGGKLGFGTIFKIDTAGKETVLHSFAGPEGANPYFGSLVIDGKGNVFGTASTGGASNLGTVFALNLISRKLRVLHTFDGADGASPLGLTPRYSWQTLRYYLPRRNLRCRCCLYTCTLISGVRARFWSTPVTLTGFDRSSRCAYGFRCSRLIPLIPFSAELQRIGETIETVAEDRNRL
jgi:uncharacterized repeat protein (TIGR03803 family)